MKYRIKNPSGFITGNISLSSSKSESNRVLMIKALCNDQNFLIENLSDSDDTRIILEALKSKSGKIDCQNAGTALRFMTAYFATQHGSWLITGNDRMKHRLHLTKLVPIFLLLKRMAFHRSG
jgi:3-phosphoshikimate 1-carboxyvinyltransferase